ncbi:leucine zipper domain-containing protein, partial [Streptomyces sp. NPDC023838]|uniref:helix-turn-helix domain-containing protein n=1 Tax=Streptomyces sp. NPDC023838 TaxID=3154325 RepID=UPI0033D8B766
MLTLGSPITTEICHAPFAATATGPSGPASPGGPRHAEEVTGNVALTCRYYGISRTCFYQWLRRYQDEGLEGLRDRSSKPHHCPHATEADV